MEGEDAAHASGFLRLKTAYTSKTILWPVLSNSIKQSSFEDNRRLHTNGILSLLQRLKFITTLKKPTIPSYPKPKIPSKPRSCLTFSNIICKCQSQWPSGLRRGSAADRLLGSRVQIPPGTWMFVVNVVCYQVEVSATGRSHVQRSPTDCGASFSVIRCNNFSTLNLGYVERGWIKKEKNYLWRFIRFKILRTYLKKM